MQVIAIAGDDSPIGNLDSTDAKLLISLGDLWDTTIEKARDIYGCRKVFAIRGNHDSAGPFASGIIDLHCDLVAYEGILFGGFAGSWKHEAAGNHLYEQEEVTGMLRTFPRVDVFLAHNSPSGIHERDSEVYQGFTAFSDYIERTQPAYFIHGHQGVNQVTKVGATQVIGVSGEASLNLNLEDSDGD